MARSTQIAAVLFDLDGTLLDTAPDLVFSLNTALTEAGWPTCSLDEVKPYISGGFRAMLGYWLEKLPLSGLPHPSPLPKGEGAKDGFEKLLHRAWECYAAHLTEQTRFFDGMETVLDTLDARGLPWGIVTNKVSRFTDPLMAALNLSARCGCIVSGDTTAHKKPHPLPLLEASRRLDQPPERCVFIGDAAHDMEAGRRAGMTTLAALYGYLAAHDEPGDWEADGFLAEPKDLLSWLDGGRP